MGKIRKETRLTVNLKVRKTGKSSGARKIKELVRVKPQGRKDQEQPRDKLYEDFSKDCFNKPKRKRAPIIAKEFKTLGER